jgi:hypothetical protein
MNSDERRRKRRAEHFSGERATFTYQRVSGPVIKGLFRQHGAREDKHPDGTVSRAKLYQDHTYAVAVYDPDEAGIVCLTVQRLDGGIVRDWRDLQRIKNDLVGPERWACEVFPAESQLVDLRNTYWLWALPEGYSFKFAMFEGRRVA